MKRKPLSLLALLLSASLAFSGCELDTSTSSASSTSTKSETSIATTVSETEGSTAPFETSSVIEETTTSSTETTTPVSTTTTTVSTTAEPVVEITEFSDDMKVHFIDVDQGDSTFIELPNGEAMLIDAGETDHEREKRQETRQKEKGRLPADSALDLSGRDHHLLLRRRRLRDLRLRYHG